MGPFPARITQQDFVTPPELAQHRLASEGTGRVGGTRLQLGDCTGQTRVIQSYDQIPIRTMPVNLGKSEPLLLFLVNMTAGILDGDAHFFSVDSQSNSQSLIIGQSASRLHPCLSGFSTQQWNVHVADHSTLVVIPGPNIPFPGVRYYQRVTIDLAPTARLVWADLWFAGRYARGDSSEWFRFECLAQDLIVRRQGVLVFRDRIVWRGPWDANTAHWHFRGKQAIGTIFATNTCATERLDHRNADAATFSTAAGDTCIRMAGSSESVSQALFRTCLRLASDANSSERATQQWFNKDRHLASVHWFD